MLYKSLFLPVDKPLIDGCDVINSSGEHFTYDASQQPYIVTKHLRRAELFLVSMEFNRLVIIGKPSPDATWLKNGMNVKAADCEEWLYCTLHKEFLFPYKPTSNVGANQPIKLVNYWRIKCPTCGGLH